MKIIPACFTALLFQLTTALPALANGGEYGIEEHTGPGGFIEPLGITTLVCLITTFTLGLTMARNRRLLFPWHRRVAYLTLVVALSHAALVLLFE